MTTNSKIILKFQDTPNIVAAACRAAADLKQIQITLLQT